MSDTIAFVRPWLLPKILVIGDDSTVNALNSKRRGSANHKSFDVTVPQDFGDAERRLGSQPFHAVMFSESVISAAFIYAVAKPANENGIPRILLVEREHNATPSLNSGICDAAIKMHVTVPEFHARLHAIIRRSYPEIYAEEVAWEGAMINFAERRASYHGKTVRLSPDHFKLLALMMSYPQRVFSREDLMAYLVSEDRNIEPRVMDVNVRRIRAALKKVGAEAEQIIRTVRGRPDTIHRLQGGYAFGRPEL